MKRLLGPLLYARLVGVSVRNYGCPLTRLVREAVEEWVTKQERTMRPDGSSPSLVLRPPASVVGNHDNLKVIYLKARDPKNLAKTQSWLDDKE